MIEYSLFNLLLIIGIEKTVLLSKIATTTLRIPQFSQDKKQSGIFNLPHDTLFHSIH